MNVYICRKSNGYWRAYTPNGESRLMAEPSLESLKRTILGIDPQAKIETADAAVTKAASKRVGTKRTAERPAKTGEILYVALSAVPNLDFVEHDPRHSGGYWGTHLSTVRIPERRVPVGSLAEAVKVCQNFTRREELGGGNWTGGSVYDSKGKRVAYISYNGRIHTSAADIKRAGPPASAQPTRLEPYATFQAVERVVGSVEAPRHAPTTHTPTSWSAVLKDAATKLTERASAMSVSAQTPTEYRNAMYAHRSAGGSWLAAAKGMTDRAKAGVGSDAVNRKTLLGFAQTYRGYAKEHYDAAKKAEAHIGKRS